MKRVFFIVCSSALLMACGQARFSQVQHGDNNGQAAVTPDGNVADGSATFNLDCRNLPALQQTEGQQVPFDRLSSSVGSRVMLNFDNREILNYLLHPENSNKSLSFTHWSDQHRTSVFVNTLESNWRITAPSEMEIICYLKHANATAIPAHAIALPVRSYGDASDVSDNRFVRMGNDRLSSRNEVGTFTLYCMRNKLDERRRPIELTLAQVNKTLCGVASVHVEPAR